MTGALRMRAVLFWVLLAVFAGLSLVWIFSVPYQEGEVLRGIPADAAFVSWHRVPLDREDRLLSHPWVRAALQRFGADPTALVTALSMGEGAVWKKRLGRREMATAYVPALRSSGAPAWLFSFWAGGYSQRLRWLLELQGPTEARPVRAEPGRAIWVFSNLKGFSSGWHLSVAVREGLVLAALSPDPSAVRTALLAAENTPYLFNVRTAGIEAEVRRKLGHAVTLDCGWVRARRGDGGSELYCFEADLGSANASRVEFFLDRPAPPAVAASWGPLERLKEEAEGSAAFPWAWLYPLLRAWDEEAALWLDRLVEGVAGRREVPLWVALYGGERAGRIRSLFGSGLSGYIRGLKVPLLVLAVPASEEKRARETAGAVLDLINQNKPWGLVPRPAGISGGWEMTAIEGTLGGFYRDFAPSEEAAFTVAEGWFFLGSNLGAFENLIPLIPHRGVLDPPEVRLLQVGVDGRRLSKTLGQFLAALSLSYAVGGTPSAEQMRRQIRVWREWLVWLEEVGHVEAEWRPEPRGSRLVVNLQAETDSRLKGFGGKNP